jgi:hypothetical protein
MGDQQNQNPNYGSEQGRKDEDKNPNERAGQQKRLARVREAKAASRIVPPIRKARRIWKVAGSQSPVSRVSRTLIDRSSKPMQGPSAWASALFS